MCGQTGLLDILDKVILSGLPFRLDCSASSSWTLATHASFTGHAQWEAKKFLGPGGGGVLAGDCCGVGAVARGESDAGHCGPAKAGNVALSDEGFVTWDCVSGGRVGDDGSGVGVSGESDEGVRSRVVGSCDEVVDGGASCVCAPGSSDGGIGPTSTVNQRTLRNREKRLKAKTRKLRKRSADVVVESELDGVPEWRRKAGKPAQMVAGIINASDVEGQLKESVKRKWILKNELQALETERKIAILKGTPVEGEIKQYQKKVHAATERHMVSIEKTHAKLLATDNVPVDDREVFHGSAETVLTPGLSSGSISPDSSASQAEFRAAQKKILDLEEKEQRMLGAFKKLGISFEAACAVDKQTFTDDSVGNDLFHELYPDNGAVHYVERGGVRKFKPGMDW